MRLVRFSAAFCAAALLPAVVAGIRAQERESKPRLEPKRPQLSLRATPATGMVPVRVVATAEFKGGSDDFQDYYCPTVMWDWDDGTVSESTNDCDPYEAGKSQIRRRYSMSHNYKRSGAYKISFRLKNKQRVLTASTATVRLIGGPF